MSDLRGVAPAPDPVALPAYFGPYSDATPHPWRRYFARMMDTTIFGSIMIFILFMIWGVIDPVSALSFADYFEGNGLGQKVVESVLAVIGAVLPGAVFVGLAGTSLGKWIFGIQVTDTEGKPIGFFRGLYREIFVCIRGYGIGLPLLSLIALGSSYAVVKDGDPAPWDVKLKTIVSHRPQTLWQKILNVFGVLLIIAINIGAYLIP